MNNLIKTQTRQKPIFDSRFIIDWLSFSTRLHSPEELIAFFGLSTEHFSEASPGNFFAKSYYAEGVRLYYEPTQDSMFGWINIQFSGKGCRFFEEFGHGDWEMVFDFWKNHRDDVKIKRVDFAFDDMDKIVDFRRLLELTIERDELGQLVNLVTESKKVSVDMTFESQKDIDKSMPLDPRKSAGAFDKTAGTIYWGSKSSSFFIRAYDKAREQKCDAGKHWIRIEMQMRDDFAENFLDCEYSDLPINFLGILRKKVRYIEEVVTDSNKYRWPEHPVWEKIFKFFGNIDPRTLARNAQMDFNLEKLENYVVNQAGQAVQVLSSIIGIDNVLELIMIHRDGREISPRYKIIKELLSPADRPQVFANDVEKNVQEIYSKLVLRDIFERIRDARMSREKYSNTFA